MARHETEPSTEASSLPDALGTTEAKVQRLVAAMLDKGNRSVRENEMYLAIAVLTAEDFHRLLVDPGPLKALAEKTHGLDGETTGPLASALIARWLEVDGGAMATWAPCLLELLTAKNDFRGFILDALAANRPGEMLALVPSRKDAGERAEIITRALRELAAHDLPKARAWLKNCTDPVDRLAAEKAVRAGTVQADPLQALELAGSIDDRNEGRELIRAAAERAAEMGPGVLRQLALAAAQSWMVTPMLRKLGEIDPSLAVDLAIKSAADKRDGSDGLRIAFSALARRDPAQAMEKMAGLAGPQLAEAVSAIGSRWAERDPAAALTWLAGRPASERAGAIFYGSDALLSALGEWVGQAPGDARAWADALPAGATRDAVQTQLARSLAGLGQAAEATQVLARMGRAADPKAVAGVAGAWALHDPQAAADWAIAQPPGPLQSQALASVVSKWADDRPQEVGNWLAQFPPGEARDRSVAAFLSRESTETGDPAARIAEFDAWFDAIDDPWQRAQVAVDSFRTRKEHDSAGARAWLAALPNVDPEVIRIALRDYRN